MGIQVISRDDKPEYAVIPWEQYQALTQQDPSQYEGRLKLLSKVDANLIKLLADIADQGLGNACPRAFAQLQQL